MLSYVIPTMASYVMFVSPWDFPSCDGYLIVYDVVGFVNIGRGNGLLWYAPGHQLTPFKQLDKLQNNYTNYY